MLPKSLCQEVLVLQSLTSQILPKPGDFYSQPLYIPNCLCLLQYGKDMVYSSTIPLPYIDLSDAGKDDERHKMKEKGKAQNKLT